VIDKDPTRKRLKNALYALAELGIATRLQPALWAEAQAYAISESPDSPRRKTKSKHVGLYPESERAIWTTNEVPIAANYYLENGGHYSFPPTAQELLTALIIRLPKGGILGESFKTEKSKKYKVENRVVYLSPAWESGIQMCPRFGLCAKYCVGHSSGRQGGTLQRNNRLTKTLLWYLFPRWFLRRVQAEAICLETLALGKGFIPAIRMNGSSDIRWEKYGLPQSVPTVEWYDYSKLPLEKRGDKGVLPPNYHLTFSLDENPGSWACAQKYLKADQNVAIVVRSDWHTSDKQAKVAKDLVIERETMGGFPVVDGDLHDARFKDTKGSWVVLYAKSLAAGDSEGFAFPVTREGRLKRLSLPLANRRARRAA
jgi:hypothetical protein